MTYATISQTTGSTQASAVVGLNRVGGKASTVALSWASSQAGCVSQIQYSLDDMQKVSSQNMVWNSVPSTAASSTPQFFTSSQLFDVGATVSFLSPTTAVRMFSTTIGAGQTVFFKVLQGEGA
jgi:hypothetical protein